MEQSKLGVSHKDFSDETIKGLVNGNRSIQNLASSIVFSIRENIGTSNPWLYITISLVTKMALFLVTPVTIFVTLCVLPQAKKDYRYRDGTKYNQHTRNVATFMAVLTGLILSLIKQPEKNYK